ncbi:hypothetical protein G6F56_003833 [Rhizopus delemar]|uniref:Glutathione S-transferase 5 n=1 Tax=Rhizopus stolonifer TaxID=4846 RepID=A0A367KTQ0_RHIST|nr:hypothetical protein G6F56_003833 [Rhizopus delemar]RCI05500.1 Glutathione S-transferase 5 [Rhizopus stolonifer]
MEGPKIIGALFSTYTRTMRMALIRLNVPFQLEQANPHSKLAYKYNPFGRVPSLLHNNNQIFETMAITNYIDATFSSDLTPQDLDTKIKMSQIISILSDYVFHHIIFNVCKRRDTYEQQGKNEEEIAVLLKNHLKKATDIIRALDNLIPFDGTKFLCGDQLTWADYFFYPTLADMYAIPEGKFFAESSPKLQTWYEHFKTRKEVLDTYPGTVADIRSKKSSI